MSEMLRKVDAYWRAANYLSAAMIYLQDNPLLRRPLAPEHIKRMLLGHWGTTPGQNFIYAHLNRLIKEQDLDMIVLNDLDRFHLAIDAIDRLPRTGEKGAALKLRLQGKLREHKRYIELRGEDLPDIRGWKWEFNGPSSV